MGIAKWHRAHPPPGVKEQKQLVMLQCCVKRMLEEGCDKKRLFVCKVVKYSSPPYFNSKVRCSECMT